MTTDRKMLTPDHSDAIEAISQAKDNLLSETDKKIFKDALTNDSELAEEEKCRLEKAKQENTQKQAELTILLNALEKAKHDIRQMPQSPFIGERFKTDFEHAINALIQNIEELQNAEKNTSILTLKTREKKAAQKGANTEQVVMGMDGSVTRIVRDPQGNVVKKQSDVSTGQRQRIARAMIGRNMQARQAAYQRVSDRFEDSKRRIHDALRSVGIESNRLNDLCLSRSDIRQLISDMRQIVHEAIEEIRKKGEEYKQTKEQETANRKKENSQQPKTTQAIKKHPQVIPPLLRRELEAIVAKHADKDDTIGRSTYEQAIAAVYEIDLDEKPKITKEKLKKNALHKVPEHKHGIVLDMVKELHDYAIEFGYQEKPKNKAQDIPKQDLQELSMKTGGIDRAVSPPRGQNKTTTDVKTR